MTDSTAPEDAPTIGNLIRELLKYDPDFVITYDSEEPPPDVRDIIELITRPVEGRARPSPSPQS